MRGLPGIRRRLKRATLWLDCGVVAAMRDDAAASGRNETGGMLLGWSADSGDLVVCATVAGGPNAKSTSTRFTPDGHWQQKRLAEAYASSGRRVGYLGDWHSHPRGSGRPSPTDTKTARRVAREAGARMERPVTLILSGWAGRWRAHAYRFDGGNLRKMKVETCGVGMPGTGAAMQEAEG